MSSFWDRYSVWIVGLIWAWCGIATVWGGEPANLWPVDIHEKIFRDTAPGAVGPLELSAAQNEYESAQLGIRASVERASVSLTISPLVHEDGQSQIAAENLRWRLIGWIPITHNTALAEPILVRKAPCDMPDVLGEDSTFSLSPDETQGIWITVYVPKGTRPGHYTGTISLTDGTADGATNGAAEETLPIHLEVFSFELPDQRNLWITNWWSPDIIAQHAQVSRYSEEHWKLLDAYFQNMGEHRQNVLQVGWIPSPNGLVQATRRQDGSWQFDWSKMERMIAMAEKHGVAERLELVHIGRIDREKHEVQIRSISVFDEQANQTVSLPPEEWMEPVLQGLRDYLQKTNRLERSMIHVADEPYAPDVVSWREASERMRKIVPEIKQIDAIESLNFSDRLDIWVPKLSHFDRWRDAYEARRAEGEFWYYICCHPVGVHYPNRFMDLPGSRVRVLHWINFTERLQGYLHWGYNYWEKDAFGPPVKQYGPGDTHVVYPGKTGPLDSIRWEIERESVEDYEYLVLLTQRTAQLKAQNPEALWWLDPQRRAMEIARRVVPDLTHTERDASKIVQARRELAQEIESLPRLVVQTFPQDRSTLYNGPILIELYGWTQPGSQVTIGDTEIPVAADGTFFYSPNAQPQTWSLEIQATLNGQTTRTTRTFTTE